MKTLVKMILLSSFCVNAYSATPYYRFWRGFMEVSIGESKFLDGLNEIFIPKTVEQGKNDGLISYLPVLPKRDKPSFIPDELALVTYESEKRYRELRKKPHGSSYQKLHWEYFEKGKSKSLVPQKWSGNAQFEEAYDVLQSEANWQNGFTRFLIQIRADGISDSEYLNSIEKLIRNKYENANDLGIRSYLVLVSKSAVYEYILSDSSASFETRQVGLVLHTSMPARKDNLSIKYGEGVSRQFIFR
ncbi:MAG: hypothetical protein HOE90_10330 [Bacteriovoracaceae bacterium]|jgi:hypothetical protein|nr:hypothetical protein [Bacteriovoracaceae bacterium]